MDKTKYNMYTQWKTPEFYYVSFPVPYLNCGRQEEPAILISRLLLSMRRMYVARIRLDLH